MSNTSRGHVWPALPDPLDTCCPPGVAAWVACEQREIISNAAMGFVPNHPAAWRAVNAVEESFFERRYVGDQAGPGLVARIMLEHDDVVLWPPACFHPTVAEVTRNPDRSRLLMQPHLFAGTWVEGRRSDHPGLWRANSAAASDFGSTTSQDERIREPVT